MTEKYHYYRVAMLKKKCTGCSINPCSSGNLGQKEPLRAKIFEHPVGTHHDPLPELVRLGEYRPLEHLRCFAPLHMLMLKGTVYFILIPGFSTLTLKSLKFQSETIQFCFTFSLYYILIFVSYHHVKLYPFFLFLFTTLYPFFLTHFLLLFRS